MRPIILAIIALLFMLPAAPCLAQSQASHIPASQVEHTLKGILAEPQFHPSVGTSTVFDRLDRAWNRLKKALSDLWNRLFGFSAALSKSAAFQWIFILGFMLLSAYVLARILNRSLAHKQATGKKKFVQTHPANSRSAEEWMRAAQEAAARGDYRSAVRCRYNEMLVRLDTARALRLRRGVTNAALIRAVSHSRGASAGERLTTATSQYENHWYGEMAAAEDAYAHFSSEVEEIKALDLSPRPKQERPS